MQLLEMQLLLSRRINGGGTSNDSQRYEELWVDILVGLESSEIPVLLIRCRTLDDFDRFILKIANTAEERTEYVKEQFSSLLDKKSGVLANAISSTLSDTKKCSLIKG